MIERLARRFPIHVMVASLCSGLGAANLIRVRGLWAVLAGALFLVLAAAADSPLPRVVLAAAAVTVWGLWWGSARLDSVDRSPLLQEVGRAEQAIVEVTGPARRGRFSIRIPATMTSFGPRSVHEPILLRLPAGRSPPQGARLRVLGEIELPQPPSNGFDEGRYLRRHGIHVVLRGDRWRVVGRRGGVGGLADDLRGELARALGGGSHAERRQLLQAIVLGEDGALSDDLRDRFRESGLFHLLAVSGQNVALLAGGVLLLGWVVGISRWVAEIGALAAIGGYVLAVGAQPSVVRAGVAGALGSLAWLVARDRDRWYFLLLGALALLAWNPYNLLDAGFQLSFAAVAAIFVLAPRLSRWLEGYPMPRWVRTTASVSAACGVVTAPILCIQFGSVPIYAIPANLAAEPAMPPLLGLSFAAAATHPVSADAAASLSWLAAGCAGYIAFCARAFGALPFALVPARWILASLAVGVAAYAWRRWPRS